MNWRKLFTRNFDAERIEELEKRVEAVELADAERHIKVMQAVEKVLYQLRARESKRPQETVDELATVEGLPTPNQAVLARIRARRGF